jgi:hypothetical protein
MNDMMPGQLSQYNAWLRIGRPGDGCSRQEGFSSKLFVQTGSVAHPVSCPMG